LKNGIIDWIGIGNSVSVNEHWADNETAYPAQPDLQEITGLADG
jgi:hypothetical protein